MRAARAAKAAATTEPVFDDIAPWGSYPPSRLHRLLLGVTRRLPGALKRLLYPLRRPVKYGVHHAIDVCVWGLRLRLATRGNITEADLLFAPQFIDPQEREILTRALAEGGTFVDVGANVGLYSFWAAQCMRGRGTIIAIEPDPEMRKRLVFNLKANALTTVQVFPVALSDRSGVADLLVNPGQRGTNTLAVDEARIAGGERIAQQVETTTLAQLLQACGVTQVEALKIDIEGHEPLVLGHFFDHAPPTLWPRLVVVEHKPETVDWLQSRFASCGYRCLLKTALNFTFLRDPTE